MTMREVIYIDPQIKEEKPVEFTHYFEEGKGWAVAIIRPSEYEKIVYLGNCMFNGDMFAVYVDGHIAIYKGHLNSGRY